MSKITRHNNKPVKEFPFRPRIINPCKIKKAVFFSADESVRNARFVLHEKMPYISTESFANPLSVSGYRTAYSCIFVFDDTALNLVDTQSIRQNNKDAVIALFSSNKMIQSSPLNVAELMFPYTRKADMVFAYDHTSFRPENIIESVVKTAEDRINIKKYSKAKRFLFLIVDDEPRWFSQFLPLLYSIIGRRANLILARNFEEAMTSMFGAERESQINETSFQSSGQGDDIVCLITDIYFPQEKNINSAAGKDLIRLTQKFYPRIPIIVASKTLDAQQFKDIAYILPKGDPGSLDALKMYIQDNTGIGDFVIFDRYKKEMFRIKNIPEMIQVIMKAEEKSARGRELLEILESLAEKDAISTWLYMHSYRDLADELRPLRLSGQRMLVVLKRLLKREILRMKCTPLTVNGNNILSLQDLAGLLHTVDPKVIQQYSDNDIFSSWLDRKGYIELADELRPIHGRGEKLAQDITDIIEKWIGYYSQLPENDLKG